MSAHTTGLGRRKCRTCVNANKRASYREALRLSREGGPATKPEAEDES